MSDSRLDMDQPFDLDELQISGRHKGTKGQSFFLCALLQRDNRIGLDLYPVYPVIPSNLFPGEMENIRSLITHLYRPLRGMKFFSGFQEWPYLILNKIFGDVSYDLLLFLSLFKNYQGWNTHYLIRGCRFGIDIDIELAYFQASLIFIRKLRHRGRNSAAGHTPFGPKINQDRQFRLQDLFLKIFIIQLYFHSIVPLSLNKLPHNIQ